jgi:hypothetical protein
MLNEPTSGLSRRYETWVKLIKTDNVPCKYYASVQITIGKMFYAANVIKLFTAVSYDFS